MPKKTIQRRDWILVAYKHFSEHGEQGLNIEKISKELKCSKSSFYWHFKTRKAFIREVIDYWKSEEVDALLEIVAKEKTPSRQFNQFIKSRCKKSISTDFNFFLKQYANKNPDILYELEMIEKQRENFLKLLLKDIGVQKRTGAKANILMKYIVGYHDSLRCRVQSPNYHSQVKADIKDLLGL